MQLTALQEHLTALGIAIPTLRVLERTDSTINIVNQLITEQAATPIVVCANEQTAGRGRQGRVWVTPPTGNLAMSLGFCLQIAPERLQLLGLWLGVNVVDLLATTLRCPIQIKWPNDIIFQGYKLGGMLIETKIHSGSVQSLVISLGLNVNADLQAIESIGSFATSLKTITGEAQDLSRIGAQCIARIYQGYQAYLRGGCHTELMELWARYDCLKGHNVIVMQPGGVFEGLAQGIDAAGGLQVGTTQGTRILNSAKVIQLADTTSASVYSPTLRKPLP